jgi:2-polyprenyl-3-methyl-5-hydroxy-6-metoxy-1,4-benzoquinol methylase
MRRLLRRLDPVLQSRAADLVGGMVFRAWTSAIGRRPPDEALRRLLRLADGLLARVDVLAVDLDGGVHAKHRIMRYHDFFVDRVRAGERVLDVGCGKGELAYDLASRGGAHVTGIDVNRTSLAFARARFPSDRLELVEADALEWVPPRPYDVVVLSNVLEHVADRVGLLRRLVELAGPDRVLLRVPVLERDWLVGLRRDLGLPYFSDPTHETEYSPEQLEAELRDAGLRLDELQHRWGELWAVARRS